MGGDITHLVGLPSLLVWYVLIFLGSTEHWGPCDEDALDQQDIRQVSK